MDGHTSVVVTGLGATCPVGADVAELWEALLAGRSGVRRLDEPWAEELPVRIAAPVRHEPGDVLGAPVSRRLDRVQQLGLVAAREAWDDAGRPEVDPDRLAVVVGSGVGGFGTLLQQGRNLAERGSRGVSPYSLAMFMPDGPAVTIGLELGARAGVHTPVSACASGAEAIALALDLIRAGRADIVVCGGAEAAVHQLSIAGFSAIRALSGRGDRPSEASRPFDADRDGFVLGEGAAILVLESATHARGRGVVPYAELAGAGMSADSHHVVAPDPSGSGAARAMRTALADAGEEARAVVHVNAHATSTPLGDTAESLAINAALGPGCRPAVTATKSMTGHLLGAAGALEAIVTVLSAHEGLVPGTLNLDRLDTAIDLDVVTGTSRTIPAGLSLTNSFGFGGHNVCLAIRPLPTSAGVARSLPSRRVAYADDVAAA
ncbi:3-oxoacyl-(acyl-carrier-protein) synthase 1 [Nostocoides japonicum T1-X7]|uniref:3-oxoacyl-(Acyl-carrier-protein) synthase 1 n=1 Tax=Nostocoides japonicum T1-X7 TaxID=1194083 RepID=A0A077M340_9MICO|nr:beta-ketoacyl-[acyl-carrier-protein] synthase family protein [Tetrasphaera japonica]CCH78590.1 3-oxoacyl-(acyl-carrier-protein) synthase 1 [Tetrasphaera japonica T1-X7]